MSLLKKIGSFGLGLFALYNINCAKECETVPVEPCETISGEPSMVRSMYSSIDDAGIVGIGIKKDGKLLLGLMYPLDALTYLYASHMSKIEKNDGDKESITMKGYWDTHISEDKSDTFDYLKIDTLIIEGDKYYNR